MQVADLAAMAGRIYQRPFLRVDIGFGAAGQRTGQRRFGGVRVIIVAVPLQARSALG